MPFLQEVATEIMIVMLCINGMIFVGNTLEGIPLKTPFDTTLTVKPVQMPNIYSTNNSTGAASSNSLVNNFTNNITNSTNNSPLSPIQNNVFFVLNGLYYFWAFLSGGFIWNAMLPFGFPLVFIYVLNTVIGLLVLRNIVYIMTGR